MSTRGDKNSWGIKSGKSCYFYKGEPSYPHTGDCYADFGTVRL